MPLNVIATSLERTSKQNTKQTNNKGEEKSRKEKKGLKFHQRRNWAKYKMSEEKREEY